MIKLLFHTSFHDRNAKCTCLVNREVNCVAIECMVIWFRCFLCFDAFDCWLKKFEASKLWHSKNKQKIKMEMNSQVHQNQVRNYTFQAIWFDCWLKSSRNQKRFTYLMEHEMKTAQKVIRFFKCSYFSMVFSSKRQHYSMEWSNLITSEK